MLARQIVSELANRVNNSGSQLVLLEGARKEMRWMRLRREKLRHYVLNSEDGGAIFNPSFFLGLSGIGYQMLR